jgi:hypothetical protein
VWSRRPKIARRSLRASAEQLSVKRRSLTVGEGGEELAPPRRLRGSSDHGPDDRTEAPEVTLLNAIAERDFTAPSR